jgi:hypothetical protein
MTWLAWRQFRTQALVALVGVVVLAIVYGITGVRLHDLAAASGYPACVTAGLCHAFIAAVQRSSLYPILFFAAMVLIYLVPALIGVFWGAPLVTRELESGSFRMLWTQSISRTRWLSVKLVLVCAAAMITAGVLSLLVTWWAAPIDAVGISPGAFRLSPVRFGSTGIVPVGYAAFAFTLGVAIGILVRRTLPAMAVTFAVFLAVQIVMPIWVRPHLEAPVTSTVAITGRPMNIEISGPDQMLVTSADSPVGAWTLSNQNRDSAGRAVFLHAPDACLQESPDACTTYILGLHLTQELTYQPADRYWPFQIYETGMFLALSLGLAGFSTWRVKRIA